MRPAAATAKAATSRADLLRILVLCGDEAMEKAAFALGYEEVIPAPEPAASPQPEKRTERPSRSLSPPKAAPIIRPGKLPPARFLRVAKRERLTPEETRNQRQEPRWMQDARTLNRDERADGSEISPPAMLPLTRWSRLWPFLRRELGDDFETRRPDIGGVIRRVERGESLRRLPLERKGAWSDRICILLDYSPRTVVFHRDFNRVCDRIERMHGMSGLDIRILTGDSANPQDYRSPTGDRHSQWKMPDARTPLLILSDLGMLEESPERMFGWIRFGHRLRAAGCRPAVLCPVSGSHRKEEMGRLFSLFEWDRHSRLKQCRPAPPAGKVAEAGEAGVETLMALLAPALVVEPALLRAVRYELAATRSGVADEALVWAHPSVWPSTQGVCFRTFDDIDHYQQRFLAIAKKEPALAQRVVNLIISHHRRLPESVRLAEVGTALRLMAEIEVDLMPDAEAGQESMPGAVDQETRKAYSRWQRDMVKTCHEGPGRPALTQWLQRHMNRQTDRMWRDNPRLAALWAISQRERAQKGEVVIYPPEVKQEEVAFFLAPGLPRQTRDCTLLQYGGDLTLGERGSEDTPPGSRLADLTLVGEGLSIHAETAEGQGAGRYLQWRRGEKLPAELTQQTRTLHLRTGSEILTLENTIRPDWALRMGRDHEGLWVEFNQHGKEWRVYWPEWGSDLDCDEYGLYTVLNIKGVTQRCRWIPPGTFLMGSPGDEKLREEDESQHSVTLSEGYWLADSACTQELWKAVMGDNPAGFSDDARNPVERVSWEDVQGFFEKLKEVLPGLDARLPTEAEWEYACRAGTDTPFSFGENITPEQVNYDGEYLYADGEKGLGRRKTVPVKSLPANPWGLFEIHGNVWEWCQDWYGDYEVDPKGHPIENPEGPDKGDARVLRGGSWISHGWIVRSAYRSMRTPDDRHHYFGFRLAPGQAGGRAAEPLYREERTEQARAGASRSSAGTGRRSERKQEGGLLGKFQKFLGLKK